MNVREAREAAHAAVKAFDLNPCDETADAAVDALLYYRETLRNQ